MVYKCQHGLCPSYLAEDCLLPLVCHSWSAAPADWNYLFQAGMLTRPQPHEAEATTHEAEATTHEAEATTHEAEAEAKTHLEIPIVITVSN